MPNRKVYAVVITREAVEQLGPLFSNYVRSKDGMDYLYAKEIDPNGNYFRMTIAMDASDPITFNASTSDFELQLHHQQIKFVFYAADIKKLGFL